MRTRKSDKRIGNVRSIQGKEEITTDPAVLQQKIADLNELWEYGVMDYSIGTSQLMLSEVQQAAYVYFRAVSALAEFEAEYALAKASIKRNFDLALRLSGLTRAQCEEMKKVGTA